MTVILRDPDYYRRLARYRRQSEKAAKRRKAERKQLEREYEAYLAAPSQLIKTSVQTSNQ